ncbi:MAG TPA: serine hydrolase domain-containing protein [Thermoanaerobaculia bacterium]|nr:serine hydrolase domain-containing protein [Thermoanaerobaculia bacterium]
MDTAVLASRLETLIRRLARRRGVRHVVVGACDLDGDWTWSQATGSASPDGRPMKTDTPWLLASITKLYIASVVLRLFEEGTIDLDGPIADHLPAELSSRLHVLDGVDSTDRLTARHLLAHSSGLPDSIDERPRGERSLVEEVVESGDRAWSLEEAILRARDRLSPHFPPSDPKGARPRIRYSETNYQLLMVMAEQATGRSLEQVYAEQLFEPLGLRQTWLPGTRSLDPLDEPATVWLGEQPLVDRPLAFASFKDLYATVDDVLSFGRALFSGRVFRHSETLGSMRERFTRFGFPRGMAALRAPSWPIAYGLGMMHFELSRLLTVGMRIPALIGHTGSTGSWLWYCPQLRLLIAGTVDQTSAATAPFRIVPRAVAGLRA